MLGSPHSLTRYFRALVLTAFHEGGLGTLPQAPKQPMGSYFYFVFIMKQGWRLLTKSFTAVQTQGLRKEEASWGGVVSSFKLGRQGQAEL